MSVSCEPSFVLLLQGADAAREWRCNLVQVAAELGVDVDDLVMLMSAATRRRAATLPPHPALSVVPDVPEIESARWAGADEGLSRRESEVIALIVAGLSNQLISEHLFITANTVKSYIRSAYSKIGVRSRVQAVVWAARHGFVLSA